MHVLGMYNDEILKVKERGTLSLPLLSSVKRDPL